MREQFLLRKIGIQRSRSEQYQGRIGYAVLQTILNIGLQVVLIAKPLTEVLRLVAVHIVQTDFTKLPISKKKPLDGGTSDYPRSDHAEDSFKGIGGNMLCR